MAMESAAVQALVMELQRMNQENMNILVTKLAESKQNGTMTDSRGIGKPTTFKGDEAKYAEWKAKLLAYLRVNCRRAEVWISWAGNQTAAITEEDVDLTYPDDKDEVMKFANELYSILMSCTEEGAFRICYSVTVGNGLEAIRLLMRRYEPRTPATKRALLKAIINLTPAKKPEDLEKTLMHLEELIKKYEAMGGTELPEDLRVALIIDMCHKDLKEHLELTTKDMSYKEVRDEIVNYAERKRNAFGNDLKAMEVDEVDAEYMWWGGRWEEEEWESEEVYAIGWQKGNGKGKGYDNYYGKGGYKGNGKGYGKDQQYKGGYKGYGKNDSKGSKGHGKDGMYKGAGKGKGGGFQGHCHRCGEWGHSASRCKDKDVYMDGVRARNGKGSGRSMETDNVEDKPKNNDQDLENLEAKGGYRTLCSIEARNPIKLKNRFDGLEVNEIDHELGHGCHETIEPPGLEGFTPVVRRSLNKVKKEEAKKRVQMHSCRGDPCGDLPKQGYLEYGTWVKGGKAGALGPVEVYRGKRPGARTSVPPANTHAYTDPQPSTRREMNMKDHDFDIGSLDSLELNTVNVSEAAHELTITIDSGASENVIGPSMVPSIPVVESEGSKEGVMYVTANGTVMPNRGEQHVHVVTKEGHKCMLNMQVTDVKKPLMSVARICDAGHEVVFTAGGGMIKHVKTGQVTKFNRVDNVYRLKVDLPSGFARPGQQQ